MKKLDLQVFVVEFQLSRQAISAAFLLTFLSSNIIMAHEPDKYYCYKNKAQ